MIGLDSVKTFIADLARPFAIISTSFAASWGIIVVAYRVHDGNDGALYIAASLTGVGSGCPSLAAGRPRPACRQARASNVSDTMPRTSASLYPFSASGSATTRVSGSSSGPVASFVAAT